MNALLIVLLSVAVVGAIIAAVIRIRHQKIAKPFGISWAEYQKLSKTETGREALELKRVAIQKLQAAEIDLSANEIRAKVIASDLGAVDGAIGAAGKTNDPKSTKKEKKMSFFWRAIWSTVTAIVSVFVIVIVAGYSFAEKWESRYEWVLIVGVIVAAIFIFIKINSSGKKSKAAGKKSEPAVDDEKEEPAKKSERKFFFFRRRAKNADEKEIDQVFFPHWLWTLYLGLLSIFPISILIYNLAQNYYRNYPAASIFSTVASLLIALFFLVRTIKAANIPLPEKDEFAVTIFKKYCGTRKKPGLFFPFPRYGWVELLGVSTEDDREPLFQIVDEGTGKIRTAPFDLDDASIPLVADVFFRVVDSYKFFFGNEDSVTSMKEYVEAYLRRVFRVAADPANGKPERIMNMEEALLLQSVNMISRFNAENNDNGETHVDFIEKYWGIRVFRIQVRDFDLSKEQRDDLNLKLKAKKEREAAKDTADKIAMEADGKARGIERLAKASRVEFAENAAGYADAVESLDGKVSPDGVLHHLREMKKFGMPNATLVISSGSGNAAFGAEFEAGRQAFDNNNKGDANVEPKNSETVLPKERPDGSSGGTKSSGENSGKQRGKRKW